MENYSPHHIHTHLSSDQRLKREIERWKRDRRKNGEGKGRAGAGGEEEEEREGEERMEEEVDGGEET